METMTSEQIETIWSSISHYVPERQKLDCAIDYVKTLVDQGADSSVSYKRIHGNRRKINRSDKNSA